MTTIIRARNSTRRIGFTGSVTIDRVTSPMNLTSCSLQLLIDTEQVESTPVTPVRLATVTGVITDAVNGQAYFPITTAVTGTAQTLYYQIWVTDAVGETWPVGSGQLIIEGGLK